MTTKTYNFAERAIDACGGHDTTGGNFLVSMYTAILSPFSFSQKGRSTIRFSRGFGTRRTTYLIEEL